MTTPAGTLTRLEYAGDRLRWRTSGALSGADAIPLDTEAIKKLDAWSVSYRQTVAQRDDAQVATLLAIGREMYDWLGGDRGVLGSLRTAGVTSPWRFEVVVPGQLDPLARTVLEAPWELLADAGGHLAMDRKLKYMPLRRIGEPGPERAPSPHRLRAVFMAASPRDAGLPELGFEDEENAILKATERVGMDLVVEETGNLELLTAVLAEEQSAADDQPVDVVHLSCHGTAGAVPCLLLESETGHTAFADIDRLDDSLVLAKPRLLLLSACETAASPGAPKGSTAGEPLRLGSLATELVERGLTNVLGWAGPVRDDQATRFAAKLYQRLAHHRRLDDAVAVARQALFERRDDPRSPHDPSRDWHLARLYLGPGGGGVLARGKKARTRRSRASVHKAFLDARNQVPVAAPEEFVGRRRPIQDILGAFRNDPPRGVLVQGLGSQGKSSLASRIAQRHAAHALAVLHGTFEAAEVLTEVARAIGGERVGDWVAQRRPGVALDASRLGMVLRQLLETFGNQGAEGGKPVLLVLDDLEQCLDQGVAAPMPLIDTMAEVVPGILGAFDDAETDSRLLVTSRFTLRAQHGQRDLAKTLDHVNLPAMRGDERRKQVRAKLQILGATTTGTHQPDAALIARALEAAQGNPGLQAILTDVVVNQPTRAASVLDAMDAYLRGEATGHDEAEVATFLETIAIGKILTLLDQGDQALLAAATLFELPVPLSAVEAAAKAVGAEKASIERLQGLGILERQRPPMGDHGLAINALVEPRAERLDAVAAQTIAAAVAGPLLEAWGGIEEREERPFDADIELARLAMIGRHAEVAVVTAADAVMAFQQRFDYRAGASVGRAALELLDAEEIEPPQMLLRKTGEVLKTLGDTDQAFRLLERAIRALSSLHDTGSPSEPKEEAMTRGVHARLLVQRGETDRAHAAFEKVLALFEAARAERARAVTLGDIARILVSKGEVSEGLKLHKERLEEFERLGDRLERAVTLGEIARILVSKGEVSEGLKLQEERLSVSRALGDKDEIASAHWDLWQIKLQMKDQERVRHIRESYRLLSELGRLDGIAVVGLALGQLLASEGQVENARGVLERSRAGFEKLGWTPEAEQAAALLARLADKEKEGGGP